MDLWRVTIEVKTTRVVEVAAASAAQARDRAGYKLRAGEKVMDAAPSRLCDDATPEEALSHLRGQAFLDHQGAGQSVGDWLLRARAAGERGTPNQKLALVGLRVLDSGEVAIAPAHPAIRDWFADSYLEKCDLAALLRRHPQMRREPSPRYFAGLQFRCISAPFAVVVPEGV